MNTWRDIKTDPPKLNSPVFVTDGKAVYFGRFAKTVAGAYRFEGRDLEEACGYDISADRLTEWQSVPDTWKQAEHVEHPAHYNVPGRKECIVEMLEKFGPEKVAAFCELNAYKYRYRHDLKGGEEDIKKAEWYEHFMEGLV